MHSPERPLTTPNDLALALTRIAWLCLGGALGGLLVAIVAGGESAELPKYNLIAQDAPVLSLLALGLLAGGQWLKGGNARFRLLPIERFSGWKVAAAVAFAATIISYAGTYLVYRRFALSMDEFLAQFDMTIIASGRLLAPVPAEWREYVSALQPMLMLQVPGGAHWTSSYLPVNAAIRALFLLIGDDALAGPVLAAVAILALYGIARRLWPERPDAALVAALLLATSSQFLITAMTPYAMTAHLALNLVWLWLFLRDTKTSHALAACVGFAACGLHQLVFHPFFVAPFLLTVLRDRRWKLAGFYAAAYAAIGLFWILYWTLLLHGIGQSGTQAGFAGLANLVRHIGNMIDHQIIATIPNVGLLLFRFVAWQSPLLVPLALISFIVSRRQSPVMRDLSYGFFLMMAVLVVLVPFQGHGWGYRYVHGLLGSFTLLAAQGWVYVTERRELVPKQTAALLISLLVSLLVIFPWFAYRVRTFAAPYIAASEAIARSNAQVVIIDPVDIFYGSDFTRNDPFLRNSPKVMVLGYLNEAEVKKLCESYDVAIFDRQDAPQFGLRMEDTAVESPRAVQYYGAMRKFMASLNCGRRAFDASATTSEKSSR